MSCKSFAWVAALGAMSGSALAVPSLRIVDTGNGTGSLFIDVTSIGSIAAEVSLTLPSLTGATVNTALFNDANPGDNPFIAGSPVGGDSTGLALDIPNRRLFASFGAGAQATANFAYRLLDFTHSANGLASAAGLVAQLSAITSGLSDTENVTVAPVGILGDTNGDGVVNAVDLNNVRNNFGQVSPPAIGNADGVSGPINAGDLNAVRNNFGLTNPLPAFAVAVPEPATAALCGLLAIAGFRRSR